MKTSYWINLEYATFGITVDDNIVTEVPPIAKWMLGKNIHFILSWVQKKKGEFKVTSL
jgi:hypothetical protein